MASPQCCQSAHHGYHGVEISAGERAATAATHPWTTMTTSRDNTVESTAQYMAAPGLRDILVVEDSPTQAQHLVRLLAAEPLWRARVAPDGLRALDAVRVKRPDLVISDVAMPGMDGYTLCRTLKAEPGGAALPVMLLTSLNTLEDIVRALDAGADGFLSKPYDPQQLRARVRSMLDERSRGTPAGALECMAAE